MYRLLAVLIILMATVAMPAAAVNQWTTSTTVTPSPVPVGGWVTINTTATNNWANYSKLVADFGVYNSSEVRVHQQVYTNLRWNKNETKTFSFPVQMNTAGNYHVHFDIFTQNWNNLLWRVDPAATFTVTSVLEPTPTPTSTSTPTPTPIPPTNTPTPTPIPPTNTPTPTPTPPSGPTLLFSDEFSGTSLDTSKWVPAFWYGDSLGSSTKSDQVQSFHLRSNVSVSGGYMHLRAAQETVNGCGGDTCKTYPYSSAVVTTGRNGTNTGPAKFEYGQGYLEYSVKFPRGSGMWSGLAVTEQWPPTTGTIPFELDSPEVLGNLPNRAHLSIHDDYSGHSTTGYDNGDFTTGFHTFGIEKLPNEIVWYVDGIERRRVSNDPKSLQTTYFFMDVQVGACGSWAGCPDANTVFPAETLIDYVRVWSSRPTQVAADPCLDVPAYPEFRSGNVSYNQTHVAPFSTFQGDSFDPYYANITGGCYGDTRQILEWAAKKWGFGSTPSPLGGPALNNYADVANAMAINESWWREPAINPDGPTYGILQVKCGVWPECEKAGQSTSFSADYAMAVVRAHYDGVSWLTTTQGNILNSIAAWECGCENGYPGNGYAPNVERYMAGDPWSPASPNYCSATGDPQWFCPE